MSGAPPDVVSACGCTFGHAMKSSIFGSYWEAEKWPKMFCDEHLAKMHGLLHAVVLRDPTPSKVADTLMHKQLLIRQIAREIVALRKLLPPKQAYDENGLPV
jgi:hypothetical protein